MVREEIFVSRDRRQCASAVTDRLTYVRSARRQSRDHFCDLRPCTRDVQDNDFRIYSCAGRRRRERDDIRRATAERKDFANINAQMTNSADKKLNCLILCREPYVAAIKSLSSILNAQVIYMWLRIVYICFYSLSLIFMEIDMLILTRGVLADF